jgi:hypothetical protein
MAHLLAEEGRKGCTHRRKVRRRQSSYKRGRGGVWEPRKVEARERERGTTIFHLAVRCFVPSITEEKNTLPAKVGY